jgi:hypothetical protein
VAATAAADPAAERSRVAGFRGGDERDVIPVISPIVNLF